MALSWFRNWAWRRSDPASTGQNNGFRHRPNEAERATYRPDFQRVNAPFAHPSQRDGPFPRRNKSLAMNWLRGFGPHRFGQPQHRRHGAGFAVTAMLLFISPKCSSRGCHESQGTRNPSEGHRGPKRHGRPPSRDGMDPVDLHGRGDPGHRVGAMAARARAQPAGLDHLAARSGVGGGLW